MAWGQTRALCMRVSYIFSPSSMSGAWSLMSLNLPLRLRPYAEAVCQKPIQRRMCSMCNINDREGISFPRITVPVVIAMSWRFQHQTVNPLPNSQWTRHDITTQCLVTAVLWFTHYLHQLTLILLLVVMRTTSWMDFSSKTQTRLFCLCCKMTGEPLLGLNPESVWLSQSLQIEIDYE